MARLFGCMLSGAWLVAWWSLGIQLLPLIGQGGLLPAAAWAQAARAAGASAWFVSPSHLWLSQSDWMLLASVVLGLLSASSALMGLWPRRALMVCAGLYVGVGAPLAELFPMLADKLLLEATLVALLLSRERPRPWAHWLARLLVIKLYLHIGASQWLAPHNDWQSGSALGSFLITTPLPTPLGWWADHLPAAVLSAITKGVLLTELFAPFCLIGPRPLRLVAALALTALQVAALLLVNYGLFAFVAVALHLFFLDERDVDAIAHDLGRVHGALGRAATRALAAPLGRAHADVRVRPSLQALHAALLLAYTSLALASFWQARHRFAGVVDTTAPLARALGHWQMVHAYTHLGSPAGVRAEPVFERKVRGEWQAVELWRQPGDPFRAPSFVAPHLPRLDVALSTWGQSAYAALHPSDGRAGAAAETLVLPAYAGALLEQLCQPLPRIQRLLRTPLGAPPSAVRLRLMRYEPAAADGVVSAGLWWNRFEEAVLAEHGCPTGG